MPKSDSAPRLHYYPWYVLDWRADFKVQRLSWKARALYREILDECWLKGSVPDDFTALAEICRCDIRDAAEHWEHIKPLLREVPGSGGHLLESPRMERERAEVHARSEQAKRAANARWKQNNNLDADALRQHQSAMPSKHSISNQTKAVEPPGVPRPENCNCVPVKQYAPGRGVWFEHAPECAGRVPA